MDITTFIIACLAIELTPGPNMAYLALLSVAEGKKAGFATVAGITLGLASIALASAFGIAQLITFYPALYEIIRWLGVGYLLWLAVSSWREGMDVSPAEIGMPHHGTYFRRGFFVNILNPKAAAFYLTVLPSFVLPDKNFIVEN